MDTYADRRDAGKVLVPYLQSYAHQPNVIILALPRGGVPVAIELADSLGLPLEVFVVRKLGVPGQEELAMGAIASGGIILFNESLIAQLDLDASLIQTVIEREKKELERREFLYRRNRLPLQLNGKTVILVDDGIATGFTMRAAVLAIRKQTPKHLVIAVPVAEPAICKNMEAIVDHIVCPLKPAHFNAVGQWYDHFSQVSDDEVIQMLSHRQDKI
ncbi:phosphoribosyltransferase [Legionella worsleiensis]|uniref:Phosphoribosyltransferase n=1 Tax=Legionella worsleiensis TaxID=45076 RepID=A0A0W1AL83_9GAMM|nr:phosphoribosyltransferase [Legionella worsleiensis]KTD82087.1 phosphoribosyltransferase [Legionella worsleiensis]STY31491.1 phosphoribosyltransferase [Legionella worsleiensis]